MMDLDELPQEPEQRWTPEQVKAFFAKLQEVIQTYPNLNHKLEEVGQTVQGLMPHTKAAYDELSAALGRTSAGAELNHQELWGLKGRLQQFHGDMSQVQALTNNRMDDITFEVIRQKGLLSDVSAKVSPLTH